MRQDVFEKLMTLPVGYFDKLQAGDIINRISYDIDTLNASLSNDILQAATGIITVVGAFIGMVLISPILLAVFAVTIPISIWITLQRSKSVRPLFRKRSASLAALNGFSEEKLTAEKARFHQSLTIKIPMPLTRFITPTIMQVLSVLA